MKYLFSRQEMERIIAHSFNENDYRKILGIIDKDLSGSKSPFMITNS